MDITPLLPKGSQIIQGYGDLGFRINGERYEGSVIVLPDHTIAWPVTGFDQVNDGTLPIDQFAGAQILLIGCGTRGELAPPALRREFRERGIVLEVMDTGAACRTFNVLLVEGRPVAAALIAVP